MSEILPGSRLIQLYGLDIIVSPFYSNKSMIIHDMEYLLENKNTSNCRW